MNKNQESLFDRERDLLEQATRAFAAGEFSDSELRDSYGSLLENTASCCTNRPAWSASATASCSACATPAPSSSAWPGRTR